MFGEPQSATVSQWYLIIFRGVSPLQDSEQGEEKENNDDLEMQSFFIHKKNIIMLS